MVFKLILILIVSYNLIVVFYLVGEFFVFCWVYFVGLICGVIYFFVFCEVFGVVGCGCFLRFVCWEEEVDFGY